MKTVSTWRKLLLVLPGSVLMYLIQTCVMGYFPLFGVMGNVLWAFLAVTVVSCGKTGAFCASAVVGMLMESMTASVNGLYIILFPLLTLAWSQAFADMSDRQRERRATLHPNRRQDDLPAPIRIALCAMAMSLTHNVVQLGYVYLSGISLTFGHFGRMLLSVMYTMGLSLLIMTPLRMFLGMYRRKSTFEGGDIL